MKFKYILLGLSCIATVSCSDDEKFVPAYTVELKADENLEVTVDAATAYQTIDGFASSDAWDMDYIGKYWSASNKEGIAELLFSREVNEKGTPKGIGLSMWRVNLGGGSAEQGDNSGIKADRYERRAECYLNQDGTYNWSKASGQRYFMEKAKEYGCESFVLFSNTPPVWFTKNGLAFPSDKRGNNLKDDCYDDFAEFLATVTKHYVDLGYNIPLISPINEPQVDWGRTPGTADQEGCSYTNAEVKKLAIELDKKLTEKGLSNTNMLLAEAAQMACLYGYNTGTNYSYVIRDFFDASKTNTYIGDLDHMPNIVCAHSYHSDKTWDNLYSTRKSVYDKAQEYGVRVYQTEWSMLDDGYEGYAPDYSDATYMDLALSMSKVMYHDLVTANMSSWSYWTSCSRERWSQKSRFYLIRVSPNGNDGEDYGELTTNGTYWGSKNLWVLGNYSRFVRPGYQRIAFNLPESRKVFGSAYISPEKDKVVLVVTNMGPETVHLNPIIEGINGKEVVAVNQYTTSEAKDLSCEPDYLIGHLPAKSVVTMVYDLK